MRPDKGARDHNANGLHKVADDVDDGAPQIHVGVVVPTMPPAAVPAAAVIMATVVVAAVVVWVDEGTAAAAVDGPCCCGRPCPGRGLRC